MIGDALDRLLPKRADHIVAVTQAIRTRLMHEIGIPAGKVTTVYTGAEAEHFSTAAATDRPGRGPDPDLYGHAGGISAHRSDAAGISPRA